jgi:Protein of unknown function (DUF2809)
MLRRIIFFILFVFCTWLAIATRKHANWFHPLIAEYGGDIIWAGMFLFLLRIFFQRTALWKLALACYALGVLDEVLQLYHAPWIESIRHTRIGGLMLGFGFMWSDILCYAIGTFLGYWIVILIERLVPLQRGKRLPIQEGQL